MKYKSAVSLVNGAIIQDLLGLCNDYFVNPWVKPYAGANSECMFCGALQNSRSEGDHSVPDCPVTRYKEVADKHKRFIVKST